MNREELAAQILLALAAAPDFADRPAPIVADRARELATAYDARRVFHMPDPPRQPLHDWDPEIEALLAKGDKIGAIKLYRASAYVSLKEAKDYVESMPAHAAYLRRP